MPQEVTSRVACRAGNWCRQSMLVPKFTRWSMTSTVRSFGTANMAERPFVDTQTMLVHTLHTPTASYQHVRFCLGHGEKARDLPVPRGAQIGAEVVAEDTAPEHLMIIVFEDSESSEEDSEYETDEAVSESGYDGDDDTDGLAEAIQTGGGASSKQPKFQCAWPQPPPPSSPLPAAAIGRLQTWSIWEECESSEEDSEYESDEAVSESGYEGDDDTDHRVNSICPSTYACPGSPPQDEDQIHPLISSVTSCQLDLPIVIRLPGKSVGRRRRPNPHTWKFCQN
ncbi:hypothetical protein BaRGS_00016541, partial [Batillaria attramentaria]